MQDSDQDLWKQSLSHLLKQRPGCAQVFWQRGMLCPGCPFVTFCDLDDVCREYDQDRDELTQAMRQASAEKCCEDCDAAPPVGGRKSGA
ncbi:hypothetical protein RSK20926_03689 [Roseobacter sp. SK209-2-6]|uniref:hypothetical protein n=1 Tax=Roseobacter sp. SK209-2-6 TaxID=388739 RepID=UPI0000F3EEFF|nr:hypothetical protein [Roseobacter sp. SK209-2-6]EBA16876.1 hypothetical protein RSK20926_03689 [Roseobacter sp. SK209-2-6]